MAYGIDNNTVFFLRGDSYLDLSKNAKAVTNTGTSLYSSGKFGSKSINMTNGYMAIHNCFSGFNWAGDFTIEFWEYVLGSTAKGALFQNRSTTTTANTQQGLLWAYHGTMLYVSNATGWANGASSIVNKNVTSGVWVHWALVKQGTSYKVYRNGTLFWSATYSVAINACDNGLLIGSWLSASSHDYGYGAAINEYRISNVARYTANFTPATRPMTSVEISDKVNLTKTNVKISLSKNINETIKKIDVLYNNNIIHTQTVWKNSLSINKSLIGLSELGSTSFEVRVYYYEGYYESKTFTVTDDGFYDNELYGIDDNTIFYLRGDSINDLSINKKTITNKSIATKSVGGYTGFDLSTGKLIVDDGLKHGFSFEDDLTIEWWEYHTGTSTTGSAIFVSNSVSGYYANAILLGYRNVNLYVSNYQANHTWTAGISAAVVKDVTVNTWVHWAVVKEGKNWRSYKNGNLFWSQTSGVNPTATNGAFTIGGWADSDTRYYATIKNYRVSNVARYSSNFTPSHNPFTSIRMKVAYSNNNLTCELQKASASETISKIEIFINNSLVKTYTGWVDNISYDIDENDLSYGDNDAEVRVTICDNSYISEKTTIERFIEVNTEKLTNAATYADAMNQISIADSIIKTASTALTQILNAKGVPAGENSKLTQLVCLVSKISSSGNANADYVSQISTLTSQVNNLTTEIENNKLALVNALTAKNIECSIDEDYPSLITKIDLLEEITGPRYLYKSGDTCDSITGGYVTKYSFTSASATYNANNILIKANAGLSGGASVISTKSMIDITKYKYLKAKININSASANGGFMLYVKKTFGSYPWTDNIASSNKYLTLGSATITLDISTLSGSHYIALGIDAGSSGSATMSATVYELWLE